MRKKAREAVVYALIFAVVATGVLLLFIFGSGFKADEPGNKPSISQSISSVFLSASSIKVNWQDISDNELGFKVERAAGNLDNFTEIASTGPNVTTVTDGNLLPETQYYYRICAYNSLGSSPYSEITSPPKLQNKDYLLGAGDFEFSTMTEESNLISQPTPDDQVANGWYKTDSTTENSVLQIKEGEGINGSNAQYMALKNVTTSAKSITLKRTLFYNQSVFQVGSRLDFVLDKVNFRDYQNLPNASNVSYSARMVGYDKSAVKLIDESIPIYDDSAKVEGLGATVPENLYYIAIFISVRVSGNIENRQPGMLIDGAHLFVKLPGQENYAQAQFPFERQRTMKTGMVFYDQRVHDPYWIAENFDWIDGGQSYLNDGIMLKKLNPNMKVYLYFNAATIVDMRDTNYQDPTKYPMTKKFAEAMTNHPEWFYDRYDRTTTPFTDLENFEKYPDEREEYKKCKIDQDPCAPENIIEYFFPPAYSDSYIVDPSNSSYQEAWKADAIKFARFFKVDGLFIDTLEPTGPWQSIRPSWFNTPEKVQNFSHAVYPALRDAGLEIVYNNCLQHYGTYFGKTVMNPFFQDSDLSADYNQTPRTLGLNDMLSRYYDGVLPPAGTFSNASGETVTDQFFQEWAFIYSNDEGNLYDTNHWLKSLSDMDIVKEFNTQLPAHMRKTVFQNTIAIDDEDNDPAIGTGGWAQFSFGSFMLGKNDHTLFGIERRVRPTDPSGTLSVPLVEHFSLSEKLGYELSDRQVLTELYPDSLFQIREFSKGLVVVNGHSTSDRDYTLASSMLDENGNSISGTITLPPRSARVLFKLPISTATITNNPLSKNGQFRQVPQIAISAQGAVGDSPDIYYAIDGGTEQLYSSPIIVTEGNHTLSYYSKIDSTLVEEIKTMEIVVDLTPPELPVLYNYPYSYIENYTMRITNQPEFNQVIIDEKSANFNSQNNAWESNIVLNNVGERKFVDAISEDMAGNQTVVQIEIGRRKGGDCYGADPILADGFVGLIDLSCLAASWRTTNYRADFNGDGFVDLIDLSILSLNWKR